MRVPLGVARTQGIPYQMVQLVRTDAFILFFLGAVEWGARDVDQAYVGTLQEDPLSPYLFIIAIDTLQYIFHKATQEGLLSPLRDRVAWLRLSLYADDTVLFINPNKADMDMTMEIMQGFGKAAGLHMNITKSLIVPIRCEEINLDEVLPFQSLILDFL
jgi:hypothetical protein